MLHYKEISYEENIEDLKKFKKNDTLNVKIIEIKDDKIRFSKRALNKDPLDWFKDNKKKIGSVIKDTESQKEITEKLLDEFNLQHLRTLNASVLSGGEIRNQQVSHSLLLRERICKQTYLLHRK